MTQEAKKRTNLQNCGRKKERNVGSHEGTRTRPDNLVNRLLTKYEGHIPKKLYGNQEIVVE